jgi:methylmalonyl-CoA mutase
MEIPQFEKIPKSVWQKKAREDLKLSNDADILHWYPFEGIEMEVYYDTADLISCQALTSYFSQLVIKPWDLLEQVLIDSDPKSANQTALHALQNGASGILFVANNESAIVPNILFDQILAKHCNLSFAGKYADQLNEAFLVYFDADRTHLSGFVSQGSKLSNLSNIKSLGYRVHSRYDIVPELSTYVGQLQKYYDEFGPEFIDSLNVTLALGKGFYQNIALVRSIKWLTHLFAKANEISAQVGSVYVHAEVEAAADYKASMLLNTAAGVSGALAGVSSMHWTLDSPKSREFNTRISRNTGNLLRDESKLQFDKDPVAGSYFLDVLTETISKKAWDTYYKTL